SISASRPWPGTGTSWTWSGCACSSSCMCSEASADRARAKNPPPGGFFARARPPRADRGSHGRARCTPVATMTGSVADAVRLQPAHPDAQHHQPDQHDGKADAPGQCPYGAGGASLVGQHEIQCLAKIENDHEQHHDQGDLVDGFHAMNPKRLTEGSIRCLPARHTCGILSAGTGPGG